jgi:hypothetical protein
VNDHTEEGLHHIVRDFSMAKHLHQILVNFRLQSRLGLPISLHNRVRTNQHDNNKGRGSDHPTKNPSKRARMIVPRDKLIPLIVDTEHARNMKAEQKQEKKLPTKKMTNFPGAFIEL